MKILMIAGLLSNKEQNLLMEKAISQINSETKHSLRFSWGTIGTLQARTKVKEKPPQAVVFAACSKQLIDEIVKDINKTFPTRHFQFFAKDGKGVIKHVTNVTSFAEVVGLKALATEEVLVDQEELQSA